MIRAIASHCHTPLPSCLWAALSVSAACNVLIYPPYFPSSPSSFPCVLRFRFTPSSQAALCAKSPLTARLRSWCRTSLTAFLICLHRTSALQRDELCVVFPLEEVVLVTLLCG